MSTPFEQCIEKGNLVKIEIDPELISKEFEEAELDLNSSEKSAAENNFKWAIIQAHYSINHSFRALLFSRDYRAKGHLCLKAGIEELFIKSGLLSENYLKDFDYSTKVRKGEEDQGYFHKEDFALFILESAGELYETAMALTGYTD